MEASVETLRLNGHPAELATARTWLRTHLAAASADPADALLVLTELLTNAIRHGRSAPTVTLRLSPDRLHLEVSDESPSAPMVRDEPDATGGYGLQIVDRIAEHWGWRPTTAGKVVWTDLLRRPRPS
jgi:anti-sigma regulatory factor (Ser/Thr protein kinase)